MRSARTVGARRYRAGAGELSRLVEAITRCESGISRNRHLVGAGSGASPAAPASSCARANPSARWPDAAVSGTLPSPPRGRHACVPPPQGPNTSLQSKGEPMARKPNYDFERKERERLKSEKNAARAKLKSKPAEVEAEGKAPGREDNKE